MAVKAPSKAKGRKGRTARSYNIPDEKKPPKKPHPPRLGPPIKDFKPRRWPKELS